VAKNINNHIRRHTVSIMPYPIAPPPPLTSGGAGDAQELCSVIVVHCGSQEMCGGAVFLQSAGQQPKRF